MSLQQKPKYEFQVLGLAALFFGCWIIALAWLKQLLLAKYCIAFHGLTLALVGALN